MRVTNFQTDVKAVWWQILKNANGLQLFGDTNNFSTETYMLTIGI